MIRKSVRSWLARHENLYAFLWYLHLVRNERPVNCQNCGRICPWCRADENRKRRGSE